MHIQGIDIDGFLSYCAFVWRDADPDLNVLVGPNGSGKTNLFHALRAAVDAFSPTARPAWTRVTRRHGRPPPFRIDLDFALTTEWERAFLCAFVRAALCREGVGGLLGFEPLERLAQFLRHRLQPDDLCWLWAGRLVVLHRGDGAWMSWYESLPGRPAFRLTLEGYQASYPEQSALYAVPFEPAGGEAARAWFDVLIQDHRDALLAYLRGEGPEPETFDFLNLVTAAPRGVALEVRANSSPLEAELERYTGARMRQSEFLNASWVFGRLLKHAFVFTDNMRQQPQEVYPAEALRQPTDDIGSGQHLALYLFQKKNGDCDERRNYTAIGETFERLTGQRFDVGLRRTAVPGEELLAPDTTRTSDIVDLEIHVVGDDGDIPLAFSGAGRAEALFLSAIIRGEEGRVVLLDEPAQNLHPTLQTSLLTELRRHAGNQFFLVTHAPALVPPNALASVSRLYMADSVTRRAALGPLDGARWAAMQRALQGSTDARALLFSRGVILVEGDTELGALPRWYEQQYGRSLADRDIAVYNVGGDYGFETFVSLLRQFETPWAIVCDGGVIGDAASSDPGRRDCRIADQLRDAGVADAPTALEGQPFARRRAELAAHGVFTVAESSDAGQEGFEETAAIRPLWAEIKREAGSIRSKPRLGYLMADRFLCPTEIATLLKAVVDWLSASAN